MPAMFDLCADGTIAIDFEVPDGDTVKMQKIVVKSPPTFGAYKRIRAELAKIAESEDAYRKQLQEDDAVTGAQFAQLVNTRVEDDALAFWSFVLVGDESFKGLAVDEVPDQDGWPPYLSTNESLALAIAHWKSVPLARGGQVQLPT